MSGGGTVATTCLALDGKDAVSVTSPIWRLSFGFGATDSVLERMQHKRRQSTTTHPEVHALARRDPHAVKEWIK
jgi:hypothetical protein